MRISRRRHWEWRHAVCQCVVSKFMRRDKWTNSLGDSWQPRDAKQGVGAFIKSFLWEICGGRKEGLTIGAASFKSGSSNDDSLREEGVVTDQMPDASKKLGVAPASALPLRHAWTTSSESRRQRTPSTRTHKKSTA